jgi:hypothetical protein
VAHQLSFLLPLMPPRHGMAVEIQDGEVEVTKKP